MKFTISKTLSILLMASFLAACGGGGSGDDSSPDTSNPTPVDPVDPVDPDPVDPDPVDPDPVDPDPVDPDPVDPDPVDPDPVDPDPVDPDPVDPDPVDPVTLLPPENFTMSSGGIKTFQFSWEDSENATSYTLLENIDGQSGFSVIRENIPQGEQTVSVEVSLHQSQFAQYMVQACIDERCSGFSDIAFVQANRENLLDSVGFIKTSNAQANDRFGGIFEGSLYSSASMSLSADGLTLAVGAPQEDSASNTINGVEDNNGRSNSGAVYVFVKTAQGWQQQAYIKARNAGVDDHFGEAVSVSADGNTLVVGTRFEDSNATGTTPTDVDEQNNSASNSGAVYVFTRSGEDWSQQAYIKSSNSEAFDQFGVSVDINAEGNRMAVGAFREDSNTVGVSDVSASDNGAGNSGAVFVFDLDDDTWVENAYIKASNTQADDIFGANISLSDDGNTLAVGTRFEDSNASVINGDDSNNNASNAGAAYVFAFSDGQWAQQAYIKASNSQSDDAFGDTLDLSANGDTLVVGARGDDSASLNESDNSRGNSGAAYVFVREVNQWRQHSYIKASTIQGDDLFGRSVSISSDGQTIAVGANGEDSSSPFLAGEESNNGLTNAGAVYVFELESDTWVQKSFVKASNPGSNDEFGRAVSLSSDGSTLAVGTDLDDNSATGINGDQVTKGANNSGVVYLY